MTKHHQKKGGRSARKQDNFSEPHAERQRAIKANEEEIKEPEVNMIKPRKDFIYRALKKLGPNSSLSELDFLIETDKDFVNYRIEYKKMNRTKISKRIYKLKGIPKKQKLSQHNLAAREDPESRSSNNEGNIIDSDDRADERDESFENPPEHQRLGQVLGNEQAQLEDDFVEVAPQIGLRNEAIDDLMNELCAIKASMETTQKANFDLISKNLEYSKQVEACTKQIELVRDSLKEDALQQQQRCNHEEEMHQLQKENRELKEKMRELKKKLRNYEPIQHKDINDTIDIPEGQFRTEQGFTEDQFNNLFGNRVVKAAVDTCSVCFELFQTDQNVVTLYCSPLHKFHKKCIEVHFFTSKRCPLCKQDQVTLRQRECILRIGGPIPNSILQSPVIRPLPQSPRIGQIQIGQQIQFPRMIPIVENAPDRQQIINDSIQNQRAIMASIIANRERTVQVQQQVESEQEEISFSNDNEDEARNDNMRNIEEEKEEQPRGSEPLVQGNPSDGDMDLPDKEVLNVEEVQRLESQQYLNDGIIDAFIKLWQLRQSQFDSVSVHIITALNMQGLINGSKFKHFFKNLARLRPKLILSPMNLTDHHWALLCADLTKHELIIIDSLGQQSTLEQLMDSYKNHIAGMKKLLLGICKEQIVNRELQTGRQFNFVCRELQEQAQNRASQMVSTYTTRVLENVPQQPNVYDCGLYVCMNIEMILQIGSLQSLKYNFTNATLPNMRMALLQEIKRWSFKSKFHRAIQQYQGATGSRAAPREEEGNTVTEEQNSQNIQRGYESMEENKEPRQNMEGGMNQQFEKSAFEESDSEYQYEPITKKTTNPTQLLIAAANETERKDKAANKKPIITMSQYLEQDLEQQAKELKKEKKKLKKQRKRESKKASKEEKNQENKSGKQITVKEAIKHYEAKKGFRKK